MYDNHLEAVEANSSILEGIVDELVESYCKDLDSYMLLIKDVLLDYSSAVSDKELEDMVLNLPNLIYFTSNAIESLGLKSDIAKAIKLDVYNKIHNETKGTVADKKAIAELGSQEQSLVQLCYEVAYKKIKNRIDAAYEQLNSIKKVIDRRRADIQLTYVSSGGR